MRFKNSNEIKILICLLTIFICFVKPLKFFSQKTVAAHMTVYAA